MQKIIFISVLALSLVGCEKFEKEREAKEYIKSYVKDPSSVQFRNVSGQCGEFNAKNGYGAYTGFDRYIYRNGNLYIQSAWAEKEHNETYSDENLFIIAFDEICTKGNTVFNLDDCRSEASYMSSVFERRLENKFGKKWEMSFFSDNSAEYQAKGKKIVDYAYNLPKSETNIQFVKAQAFRKCLAEGEI